MRAPSKRKRKDRELDLASAKCLAEFRNFLHQARHGPDFIDKALGSARHFLIWLKRSGIRLDSVDDAVLRRFRDHDCTCPRHPNGGGLYKRHAPRPQATVAHVQRFVRFLEISGRTRHPGEIETGRRLLQEFEEWVASEGHTPNAIAHYRVPASHLLIWLHRCRIHMKHLTADTLENFFEHDCLCPGKFLGFASRASVDTVSSTRKFVLFLASRGIVPEAQIARKKPLNPGLQAFHAWLRQNRGVSETTVRNYDRDVSSLLHDLGNDPAKYDAALVRKVLLRRFAKVSKSHAQRLVSVMRGYLRFLSSTGQCPASLVGAVPNAGIWRLATLPRYLPTEDIEKVIASCDGTRPADIRDLAILLLLARLGLRAGDVHFLKLRDIDWDNAEIHVCGKSRRSVRLPLPQDAGDALLAYIEQARPRGSEQAVFLRSRAPFRPFSRSSAISSIVHKALQRAGVNSPGGRGAHVLRHSAATTLLRAGASLDTVGALLRHESSMTTAIYAKVDLAMLREVAQPWTGDVR
ncbi:MAG: tyrosine-type recombinase/integrase [Boseongicola sp. SB0677_bin_26]|nr:tyrosine-type recombinase/integrase [Boseongicola sp. SB0665_bin_10]MYG25210.1 tyrosine-type recombinase/integrase [Boseongicola sp. SB0677_bin_26]